MSADIKRAGNTITSLLSYCEHLLDVSDVDIQKDNITHIRKNLLRINKNLIKICENYDTCRVLTYGANIVLAGNTNSGKSTLFNSLVGDDRSIVNKAAGTTRDYVDAKISISGVPINIVDTAGLRKSKNEIESSGVNKTLDLVKKADLVLFVIDIINEKPLQVVDNIEYMNNNILVVYNKIDLKSNTNYATRTGSAVYVSALKTVGLSGLKKNILKKLNVEKIPNKLSGVSTPRQYECIRKSLKSLDEATNILSKGFQLELVCYELENALYYINSLLGVDTDDLVLNSMFDGFCVGK
jgi:tRNA modification GTPase